MATTQQQQALDYFRSHAAEWRSKAADADSAKVNVIAQRNAYVLSVASERSATRSFLDVGCGTGELVCQMASLGIDATGMDYAPEMIDLARAKARDEGIGRAKFICGSALDMLDMQVPGEGYDLISANGLIEYISHQEVQVFFDMALRALTASGSFVVGSRNRLFNLVAMNGFTLQEYESGQIDLLIKEAVQWTTSKEMPDVAKTPCARIQAADTTHGKTGIDVTTRFQYSPLQLMGLLRDRGFRTVEVYPVHIHGVTPSFKEMHGEIHASIANVLQAHARHNTQLLAQASTFMLHAIKGR